MSSTATASGAISADEAYTMQGIKNRVGLGKRSLVVAAQKGLKIRRWGRTNMIIGRDLISYLEHHCDAPPKRKRRTSA